MTTASKPIIGLAGGIGSGKTAVAHLLAKHGCIVADSDAAARAALLDPAIRTRIVERFGRKVLDPSGEIDRSALAGIVFRDPEQRQALEAIVHPWVHQRRLEEFACAPPDAPALVIDAPLLFEAGLNDKCDAVILVDAPRETRLSRVRENRGWNKEELDRREASQMPLDEKRRMADYVITNSGSFEKLDEQVREVLATIVTSRGSR